jgi:hypothetical protein
LSGRLVLEMAAKIVAQLVREKGCCVRVWQRVSGSCQRTRGSSEAVSLRDGEDVEMKIDAF